MVFYNEFDKYAAAWLRNLIAAGHIADGIVDERSIEDIHPRDLDGFTQCHFFAGIGVWSHALRLAGWPDDRPVWTGSCPCQPFSAAGKGAGFDDERHLWPAWHHLIRERRPAVVLGEQVASSDTGPWIDLVQDDMETMGYAFGAVPFPSASVGAPHIRDRLYWVADAGRKGLEGRQRAGQRDDAQRAAVERGGEVGGMADADGRHTSAEREQRGREQRQQPKDGVVSCLADTYGECAEHTQWSGGQARAEGGDLFGRCDEAGRSSPTNGFWRDADWIGCRDDRWRPVEPGTQQMADGIARGVGRLRSGGDAEKEIAHATTTIGLADQVLRALRDGHEPETIWRSLGGCVGVPQATLLLAAVCEQSWELGRIFNGAAPRGPQERGVNVRSVWHSEQALPRSPQGRGHTEQLAWQLGDVVPKLSQAGASVSALAGFTGSPLAHGAPARVGRLRAYGNAINAQQAAIFIGAIT